jgi:hypothetical protein
VFLAFCTNLLPFLYDNPSPDSQQGGQWLSDDLVGLNGGKARTAKLTAEQRRELARKAVNARWTKAALHFLAPEAVCQGVSALLLRTMASPSYGAAVMLATDHTGSACRSTVRG